MPKAKKKTKKLTKKQIRTKEVWLESLESIAGDATRDPHARLNALRQIGEMMGFKESHNFERMSGDDRLNLVKTTVGPVLKGIFGLEIEFYEEPEGD